METSRRRDRFLCSTTLTLVLLVSGLLLPQGAGAWPMFFDNLDVEANGFVGKYPTWPHTSQPNSCLTCHATSPPTGQFNPYGNAFKQAKGQGTGPAIPQALTAIAGQDSDGDGVSNELEILFGTYPGNKESKPSPASGVKASDETFPDKVRVTWSAYPNATFQLHRADSPDGAKTQLTSTSNIQHDDTTAVAGKTYHYWVKACNKAGCTGFSLPDAGLRKVAAAQAPPPGLIERAPVTPAPHIRGLPGPSSAQPGPQIFASQKAIKPSVLVILGAKLEIYGVKFQQPGNVRNSPDPWMTVPEVKTGKSSVLVFVKNSGALKSGVQQVTLKVAGGKQVGTYDWSYAQIFTKALPSVAPKQETLLMFELNTTDLGPYYFQAWLGK